MRITFIDGLSNTNFIKSPFKKPPVFMQTSVVHQIHNAEQRWTKLQSQLRFSSEGFFGASSALAFSRASYFFFCLQEATAAYSYNGTNPGCALSERGVRRALLHRSLLCLFPSCSAEAPR